MGKGERYDITNSRYFQQITVSKMLALVGLGGDFRFPVLYWVLGSCYTVLLSITAWNLIHDEFGAAIEVVHFCIILAMVMFGLWTILIRRRNFEETCRTYDEGVWEYEETLDDLTMDEIKMERDRKDWRQKVLLYGTVSLYVAAFSAQFGLKPIWGLVTGSIFSKNTSKNIARGYPVPCWFPFDITNPYGVVLAIITEYILGGQSLICVIMASLYFTTHSEELLFELRALRITSLNILRRAQHLAQTEGNGLVSQKEIDKCFSCSIKHHQKAVKLFRLFNQFYSMALLMCAICMSALICLCSFILTLDDTSTDLKISIFGFVSCELLFVYFFCYYGEQFVESSTSIGNDLYKTLWYKHSLEMKPYLIIMIQRTQRPFELSCGGLMSMNHETFSQIVNTSYTYFNLLLASK